MKKVIFNFQFSIFKKGFTLLEMLVVIGIIAVLLGVGLASYSTAQKKARDAKRKGDVNAISNALEQWYSVCGYSYPTPGTSISCSSPTQAIMPTVPTDPKSGNAYTFTGGGSSYTICANTLESESITGYCVNSKQ